MVNRREQAALLLALRLAEKEIESWADEGIHLVTVLDERYPVQLLMVRQRPLS